MDLFALVIDADPQDRRALRRQLERHSWVVAEAGTRVDAVRLLGERPWLLVFCDAALSEQNVGSPPNLTLLGEIRRELGASAHVIITASESKHITAFEAILSGAADYIRKPYKSEYIAVWSQAVIERLRAARTDANARSVANVSAPGRAPTAHGFVGESEAIIKVFKRLAEIVEHIYLDGQSDEVSPAPLPTVFITGETGTGKELAAQIIHQRSGQSKGRFVPVNCGNLTSELAESELFGHEPGAFTGAGRQRQGLWEEADGGTLFLDEITEAPPSVLPKLLRVLQDGMVKRLGSNRWRRTNVQVIAASNRDMRKEIREGRFRSDLYHRLSLHRLHLPPLRERVKDVPLIVDHLARRHFRREIRFAQDALDMLMSYPFPGNVRELENIVRGAARKSPDGVVYAVDLCAYVELVEDRTTSEWECPNGSKDSNVEVSNITSIEDSLDDQVHRFKLQIVRDTLAKHNGNATRAARALKISRPSLYRLIREIKGEVEDVSEAECGFASGHVPEGQHSFSAGVS